MEYSRLEPGPDGIDAGLRYALGSLYDRFQGLSDRRKAKGKRYSLLTLLVVIFLAKLSGQDKPGEIADWAKNHADALVQLLQLRRASPVAAIAPSVDAPSQHHPEGIPGHRE